ncbi:MAG: DUF721 domain-containing protein [Spirochaetaceae bacterium]|nr:DUF721 domain-containing protein [Spirochaetaceae bacterium]
MMEDSRIKKVSVLLSSFFDEELVKKGEKYAEFNNSWKNIAGARLGEHSRPTEIRHGMLVVEAEHSGWIQLLQLHQEKILAEIQRQYPDLEIASMAFIIGNGETATQGSPVPEQASWAQVQTREASPKPGEATVKPFAGGADEMLPDRNPGDLPQEVLEKFAKIRKNIEK